MSELQTQEREQAAGLAPRGEAEDRSRHDPGIENLRTHTARGTLINSAFQIGLSGLSTLQRVVVAAFLTRAEYGVWGILVTTLITLSFLKQVGIADKYVQQSDPDQESAFQKAFTLELLISVAFFVLAVVALPAYALAYGRPQIIVPGMVLALAVPLTAFEAPSWVPYRRMQYARQRLLTGIDPLTAVAVTITLVVAGAGYWGMIWGALAGSAAGGLVCWLKCPYRFRLRIDRRTVRDYATFSWPLMGFGLSRLLVVQGGLLVANRSVGLAGIGAIGLATNFAAFADRVDSIVSQTIYPAVCSVAHRIEVLAEAFVKSNRVALMWAMPFGVALALFAGDLVHYVLGDRWHSAVGLLIAFGLTCALGQVAFNWAVFLRATANTRPIVIAALAEVAVFLAVSVPATLAFGLAGYAAGFIATTVVQIAMRGWYMRGLFRGFAVMRQLGRAIAPAIPPAAIVLIARALLGGDRTPARVIGELVLYSAAAIAATFLFERPLVSEIIDYLRGRRSRAVVPVVPADVPGQASTA